MQKEVRGDPRPGRVTTHEEEEPHGAGQTSPVAHAGQPFRRGCSVVRRCYERTLHGALSTESAAHEGDKYSA